MTISRQQPATNMAHDKKFKITILLVLDNFISFPLYMLVSLPRPLFFFDIGTVKKGLVKWSVLTGDHVMGITLTTKVLSS